MNNLKKKNPPQKLFFRCNGQRHQQSNQCVCQDRRRPGDPGSHYRPHTEDLVILSNISSLTPLSTSPPQPLGLLFRYKEKLIFNDISNQALAKISKVMPHWMKVKLSFCYVRYIFIELYIFDLSFISRIINLTGWHTTTLITWNNGTMTICTCKRQTSFLSPWINDLNVFMQGSFHIIEPPVWLWTWLWPLRLQPRPTTTTTHEWPTVTHLPDWVWNWYRSERPAYCWRLLQRLPWSSDRLSRLSITAKKTWLSYKIILQEAWDTQSKIIWRTQEKIPWKVEEQQRLLIPRRFHMQFLRMSSSLSPAW